MSSSKILIDSQVITNLYLKQEEITSAQLKLRIAAIISALIASGAIGGAVAGVALHQPHLIIASQVLAWTSIPLALYFCKANNLKSEEKTKLARELDTSNLLEKVLQASQDEQEKLIAILSKRRVLNDVLRQIDNFEAKGIESLAKALANKPEDFAQNILGVDEQLVNDVITEMDITQKEKFSNQLSEPFSDFVEAMEQTELDENSKYQLIGKLYYSLAEGLGKPNQELLGYLSFQMLMDNMETKMGVIVQKNFAEIDVLLSFFNQEENKEIFAAWNKLKNFAKIKAN